MKNTSIMELIDDENLENALTLREQYVKNASLPKKTIILRTVKQISAACLALLLLMIPASVFLLDKNITPPPHLYRPPDNTEYKSSFQEMNDVLGSEHLYNRLPEEYATSFKIHYDHIETQSYCNISWNSNFSEFPIISVPTDAQITMEYPNGDILSLHLYFFSHTTAPADAYTEIDGIPIHLFFAEGVQSAVFSYQETEYSLLLYSQDTDVTEYLDILLDTENNNPDIQYFPKKSFTEVEA